MRAFYLFSAFAKFLISCCEQLLQQFSFPESCWFESLLSNLKGSGNEPFRMFETTVNYCIRIVATIFDMNEAKFDESQIRVPMALWRREREAIAA